eukprot:scaffold96252_cov63-Phaeocystis_antarctica.AAC.3
MARAEGGQGTTLYTRCAVCDASRAVDAPRAAPGWPRPARAASAQSTWGKGGGLDRRCLGRKAPKGAPRVFRGAHYAKPKGEPVSEERYNWPVPETLLGQKRAYTEFRTLIEHRTQLIILRRVGRLLAVPVFHH